MKYLSRVTYHHLSALIMLASCTSNEIGNSKNVNPDAIYFDYKVWAEEGKDEVTINLQYRMGGPNGTTLLLNEPRKVELDGEPVPVDSAKLTGPYYEVQKPIKTFSGKHTIVFTDQNKKEYREEFEFQPFSLNPDIPETFHRNDLVFHFQGLDPIDYIRVLMTDTSFSSDDINDMDTVRNGKLIISAERLAALSNGPINLQFYKEIEKPVKNGTKEGGNWFISYGIKREFKLR